MAIEVCNCYSCCDKCCGSGGQGLCIASSVSNTDTDVSTVQLTNAIPEKSCITKIYASAVNASKDVKYIVIEITVNANSIFYHALPNVSSQNGTTFDTNFIQPLCISNKINTVTVTAFDENNSPIADNKSRLSITVVFCENCCQ